MVRVARPPGRRADASRTACAAGGLWRSGGAEAPGFGRQRGRRDDRTPGAGRRGPHRLTFGHRPGDAPRSSRMRDASSAMRIWMRDHGLTLANGALFLVFFVGMVLSGASSYSQDQVEHGEQPVSVVQYLGTGDFLEATFENWESEFLQMGIVHRADGVPLPAGLAGLQADRRGRAAGRGSRRGSRDRPGCPLARAAGRPRARGLPALAADRCSPCCSCSSFLAPRRRGRGRLRRRAAGARPARGRVPRRSWGRRSSGSSRSRTGRASSWS